MDTIIIAIGIIIAIVVNIAIVVIIAVIIIIGIDIVVIGIVIVIVIVIIFFFSSSPLMLAPRLLARMLPSSMFSSFMNEAGLLVQNRAVTSHVTMALIGVVAVTACNSDPNRISDTKRVTLTF